MNGYLKLTQQERSFLFTPLETVIQETEQRKEDIEKVEAVTALNRLLQLRPSYIFFPFPFFMVLGIKPRALLLSGKHFDAALHLPSLSTLLSLVVFIEYQDS